MLKDEITNLDFYGWGKKGMRENPTDVPTDVPTEDVFVLRADVLNILQYPSHLPLDEKEIEIKGVIEFANKLAKVINDSKSSTALFFVQQAYPDDVDGLDQRSTDEILNNVILQSELWLNSNKASLPTLRSQPPMAKELAGYSREDIKVILEFMGIADCKVEKIDELIAYLNSLPNKICNIVAFC